MVKFANNDRSRMCCSSLDCNLSVCDVTSDPPCVLAVLKGHKEAIPGRYLYYLYYIIFHLLSKTFRPAAKCLEC